MVGADPFLVIGLYGDEFLYFFHKRTPLRSLRRPPLPLSAAHPIDAVHSNECPCLPDLFRVLATYHDYH